MPSFSRRGGRVAVPRPAPAAPHARARLRARGGAAAARGDRRGRARSRRAARAAAGGARDRGRLARAGRLAAGAGARAGRAAGARRAAGGRLAAPRARDGGARRGAHARHAGRAGARADLRVGDLLGALLRPLARGPPALVLDGAVREPGEGAAIPGTRPMRYRWTILGVGVFAQGALSAVQQGMPALGPALREELGLSLSQVGLVFACVSWGIMATLLVWGALADRHGERIVISVGLAGGGGGLGGPAQGPPLRTLLAALILAGALGGSASIASGRAVVGWFGREQRGLALGIRQMAVPLGGAVAALTLPAVAGADGVSAALLALAGASGAGAA